MPAATKVRTGVAYRIAFEDGAVYIGKTICPLPSRIGKHLSQSSNAGIAERVKRGIEFKIDILHETTDLKRLSELEIEAIQLEAESGDLINVLHNPYRPGPSVGAEIYRDGRRKKQRRDYPGAGKDRPVYPPTVEEARCSVCTELKPASEFHLDRCRHNGLHSRCKLCAKDLLEIRKRVSNGDLQVRSRFVQEYRQLLLGGTKRRQAVHSVVRKSNVKINRDFLKENSAEFRHIFG